MLQAVLMLSLLPSQPARLAHWHVRIPVLLLAAAMAVESQLTA
jgi:hypothetical protein